ncbi:MAG: hypothetical protein FD137_2390 [Spirochaetes bacterium]|nr:MAG: hypothetical protein FD137_2390 [Spirochaetota bacterium]
MRRILTAIFLSLSLGALWGQGWDALYHKRLESSSAYLEAQLALKSAEVAYNQVAKPFVPTVSIATSSSAPLSLNSDGTVAGTLVPSIGLQNILGADISLRAPIRASNAGLVMGDPSITVSRSLFEEVAAERLEAEAALLSAKAALKAAEDGVRISLATEILNAMYYKSLLAANEEDLKVLQRVRDATLLDGDILAAAETLHSEVLTLQDAWFSALETKIPDSTARIRSLELSLEAAKRRKSLRFLPYLPNPGLSVTLTYDLTAGNLDWSLALSFSYAPIDNGKAALSVLKREQNPLILAMKIQEARDSLENGIARIKGLLETLELDRKLNDLDIEDAKEDALLLERLYNGGYATEEDLVIAKIDLSVQELEGRKIAFDILIQKLNLANYYDEE